jgi:predicted DsbA family dithiol-disulfide isomerase
MSEELFLNASALGDDKFRELAGKIGINVDQFMKDYKDRDAEWEKAIEADMKIVQDIGVRGTPTYYLNGRQTMARVPEQWKQEIDAAFNSPVPDAPAAK